MYAVSTIQIKQLLFIWKVLPLESTATVYRKKDKRDKGTVSPSSGRTDSFLREPGF